MYNYILGPVDTDSVSLCKPDMSPFTEEERIELLNEINSLFPELIKYADDGYFQRCVALKAKNYILYDGVKIKVKGSSLKAMTKSQALKDLINSFIEILVKVETTEEIHIQLSETYQRFVNEAMNVKDIARWSSRKTLSNKMTKSERANETKVMEALEDSDYVEGDRFYTYYKSDDSISLTENFDGDYNKVRLLKNLYDTAKIFGTVIPVKELFINYSLKKNYKLLDNQEKDMVG